MKASTTKSKGFLVYLNECAREHLENNQPSTVITLDNIETVLKNVSNNDSDEDSDVDAINTKAKKMANTVHYKMPAPPRAFFETELQSLTENMQFSAHILFIFNYYFS